MKWDIFLMILNSKKARRANPGNGTCPSLSTLSSFISSKETADERSLLPDILVWLNPDEGL